MTLDQKIQIWNAVGTWLAAVATFSAVVFSLYMVRRSNQVRLSVSAGLRSVLIGDGSPEEKFIVIRVTNLGERPMTVANIGWRVGRGKARKYCIQNVGTRYTDACPIELAHGKDASFMWPETDRWGRDMMNEFIGTTSPRHMKTFVAQVHTSVGQTINCQAEKGLLEFLKKHAEKGC